MKKQLRNLVVLALLIGFTNCKSSSDTASENTNTSSKIEQSDKREQPRDRGQGGVRGERPDASQILAQMDANKDGMLSKDEAKGPLQESFSKIDTNQNGFISKEELENAPKPKRGGGQGGRSQRGGN